MDTLINLTFKYGKVPLTKTEYTFFFPRTLKPKVLLAI